MQKLRILLVDDHDIVRQGLRAIIENQPGWEVVGEASTGREAVAMAKQMGPDVVVLDVAMPDLNGLEATCQILDAIPESEVLILTMYDSDELVHDVLAAGARGYLLKSNAGAELVAAIDALSRHKPFLTLRISEMVLDGYRDSGGRSFEAPATRYRLTAREREIVQLLAEGKSNKEIAVALGISTRTAETHRGNVMRKLNVHSIGELVRYAIRNKIVQP